MIKADDKKSKLFLYNTPMTNKEKLKYKNVLLNTSKKKKRKIRTMKGFIYSITSEIDSESDQTSSDDYVSDDGVDHPDFKWVKSQFSINID